MSDLEQYVNQMEKHHYSALKRGETEFAKYLQYCVLTAKEFLKNIKEVENKNDG